MLLLSICSWDQKKLLSYIGEIQAYPWPFFWGGGICTLSRPIETWSYSSCYLLYFQVPQLNRRPEAPRLLSASVPSLLPLPCSTTGFPPTGQHLQPPSDPHLGRGLPCSPTDTQPAGADHSGQGQTHASLLCQHWHTTSKQVREEREKRGK